MSLKSEVLEPLKQHQSEPLAITDMEVFVVHATHRSNWIFVRLRTNKGLTGLGECTVGHLTEVPLAPFFELLKGQSPFAIETFREQAWPRVTDLSTATAFSGLEQALWDIVGKALDASVAELFGSIWSQALPVYANINRGTTDRTVAGFTHRAAEAIEEGFNALKAAPFDGFPSRTATAEEIEQATKLGIDIMHGIRGTQKSDHLLMVDCHSYFTVPEAVRVATDLNESELYWFEEPCSPEEIENTLEIKRQIPQDMAGGELLFATSGFEPLCVRGAYDVIMPDIKHCGGLYECLAIANLAEQSDIRVAPHNPSGPLATIASAHVCAAASNFDILEFQWGEADWYGDLLSPPVEFIDGTLRNVTGSGLGVELNDTLVAEKSLRH